LSKKAWPLTGRNFADFRVLLHNGFMPFKNTVRYDAEECYYHVYARGAAKADIFREDSDKDYFLYLISRHLSIKPVMNSKG
jgi:hypothetical protein